MSELATLDLEGNGLIDEGADTIWCAVLRERETGEIERFYPEEYHDVFLPDNYTDFVIEQLPERLNRYSQICMHNGIGYDRKILKIALNYIIPLHKVVDTLVLSQLLLPELKVPEGWKGKPKPHSVEAWGMRLGVSKPEHDDWSQFSPEMLFRCEQDVLIQEKILDALEKEAND